MRFFISKDLILGFNFIFKYLGKRIYLVLFVSIFLGLMDAISISVFLPFLQQLDGYNGVDFELNQSNYFIKIIAKVFDFFHVDINVLTLLIFIFCIFLIKGGLFFIQSLFTNRINQQFLRMVRFDFINSLNSVGYNGFQKIDPGNMQNLIGTEMERLSGAYRSYIEIIQNFIIMIPYVMISFFTNYKFSFFLLLATFILNLVISKTYKITKQMSNDLVLNARNIQSYLIQQIVSFKYLLSNGYLNKYSEKIKREVLNLEKSNNKIILINSMTNSIREPFIIGIIILSLIYLLIYDIGNIPNVLVVLVLIYKTLNSILIVQSNINGFNSYFGSLKNVSDMLNSLHNRPAVMRQDGLMVSNLDVIELRDYFYEANETKTILSKINIKIKLGERIGIVGTTGSGKTTLINSIAGLYNTYPDRTFFINSNNHADININGFRNLISYMPQEPVIFTDSIFNNVSMWDEKTDANLDKFWNCINNVELNSYVSSLPNSYDTILLSFGSDMSGGQRQRLALARAMYKNYQWLILDEVTSSLDDRTSDKILDYIKNVETNRTIILIAHRLETLKIVDRVIWIDDGQIRMDGERDLVLKEFIIYKK